MACGDRNKGTKRKRTVAADCGHKQDQASEQKEIRYMLAYLGRRIEWIGQSSSDLLSLLLLAYPSHLNFSRFPRKRQDAGQAMFIGSAANPFALIN